MPLRRFVALVDQRQRILGKIAQHVAKRRRLRGETFFHAANLAQVMGRSVLSGLD